MLFALTTAAVAATLASLTAAVDTNFPSCQQGPVAPSTFAGKDWPLTTENVHWCEAGWTNGDVLTGIRVWRGDWQIEGVQLKWGSHDYGPVHGSKFRPKADAEKEWDASSKVVIRTWHNRPDDGDPVDAVGKISIEVEGQDPVEAHAKKYASDEVVADTAANMILGVSGAAGRWLDTVSFIYLESTIVDTAMSSIDFGDSVNKYNDQNEGMQDAIVGNVYFINSNPLGGANQTFGFTTKISKKISKTISSSQTHTAGFKIGYEISAKIEVPLLAEFTVKTSTEYSYQYQAMASTSETWEDTWGFDFTQGSANGEGIPPQQAAACTASGTMGTFESDYRALITAKLDNGKTFAYSDSGTYNSVGWANAVQDCKMIDIKDVPSGSGKEANGMTAQDPEIIPDAPKRRSVAYTA